MDRIIGKRESSEVEELYSSRSLLIVCILLILSLLTSYYLQIKRIRAIHETVVSIFAGMVVGLVVRLAPVQLIREMLSFNHTLFFNLLLPPIILNSGYEIRQDNFFRNFGSILVFAFFGTFISAVGLGVIVYIWSFLGLEGLKLTILDCLIFGSTLSATDPVTILSIFTQYKVDPKLYSIIFGESLLNDAVSIVMYETLSRFKGEGKPALSLLNGFGIFILSFSSSMALGIALALVTSLLLKHSHLHLYPAIESCIVALLAYTSYFASNGLHMSGIVSLLFCGITLKHYAYHTMSRRTQRTTRYLFSVLAQISENFIFIYLGLNLFTQEFAVFKPLFILISTIAVIATRYLAVFPLSELINFFHRWRAPGPGRGKPELPHSYQMMLFWAGLRGAVGVALASGFTGENADALRTTVLVVVVLTVIMFGGTTARMLEVMGIRTGVVDEDGPGSSSEEEEEERVWRRSGRLGPPGARWDERASPRDSPATYRPTHARRWSRSTPNPHPAQQPLRSHGRSSSINNHRVPSSSSVFDAGSSDSDGNEVLPMSRNPPAHHYNHQYQSSRDLGATGGWGANGAGAGAGNGAGPMGALTLMPGASTTSLRQAGEAWFHAVDERYLLPLFSNAVASRTFHARRARATRRTAVVPEGTVLDGVSPNHQQGFSVNLGEEEEFESWPGSPVDSGSGSPSGVPGDEGLGAGVRGAVKRKNQEVLRSIGSFWRGSPLPRGHAQPQERAAGTGTGGTASPAVGQRILEGTTVAESEASEGRAPVAPGAAPL